MNPELKYKKLAQKILNRHYDSGLVVDGVIGPKTLRVANNLDSVFHGRVWDFPVSRVVAGIVQYEYNRWPDRKYRLVEDEFWGPNTEDAADRLLGVDRYRPDEHTNRQSRVRMPSDKDMIRHYGAPGSGQVLIDLPFEMRLDWDLQTTVTRTTCHKKIAKPLQGALEVIRDHYSMDGLRDLGINRYGGILNVRPKRGGKTLSTHAFGAAIDLYPTENRLKWSKIQAAFAKDEYLPMRDALREAGFISLGEEFDFDWMHFQINPPM